MMTDRQKQLVKNAEAHRQLVLDAERWLWAHPQTGYTEWQANEYLVEKYESLGYELVKAGNIPGFYTDNKTGRPGPTAAATTAKAPPFWVWPPPSKSPALWTVSRAPSASWPSPPRR